MQWEALADLWFDNLTMNGFERKTVRPEPVEGHFPSGKFTFQKFGNMP